MKKPVYFRLISTGRIIETSCPEFYSGSDYERIERNTGAMLKQEEAKGDLLEMLNAGQTVYSQIVSVSASGMSRSIKLHIVFDGSLINITHQVARVLGYRMSKNGGLIVGGCGVDMAFNTVCNLGRILWETKPDERDSGYSLHSVII